jgi:hypothetical protein
MSYEEILNPQRSSATPPPSVPPRYHFHRTQLPVLASSASTTSFSSTEVNDRREYGFLQAKGRDLILGIDVVASAVPELARELEHRGMWLRPGLNCLLTPA